MDNGKLPYVCFYPNDFCSDPKVRAMTTQQVGAYILLLCAAWEENPPGTLPFDDDILAKLVRLPLRVWLKQKEAVMAAFSLEPDCRWHQKRMKLEYDKVAIRSQKARQSILKRWKKGYEGNTNVLRASNTNVLPRASDSPSDSVSSEEGNGEKPRGRDPNGPPPEPRVEYVDWKNPPFQLSGHLNCDEFKQAVKGWLKHKAERKELYTNFAFSVLMHECQVEFKNSREAARLITRSISNQCKNILYPSKMT